MNVSLAEPPFNWTWAKEDLGWTWQFHTYGLGCLFFLLAFYSFFSLLNLRSQFSSRPFLSSINLLLCLLGITRAAYLLIDPYDSKKLMPRFLSMVMFDIAFPCLTSAFSLIQLAFVQISKLKVNPTRLQNKTFLSMAISFHFTSIIVTDIVVAFAEGLVLMFLVIHTIFVVWGILLCLGFLYGGYKMMQMTRRKQINKHISGGPYENKGILKNPSKQSHHASSVNKPKICITDENDHTYSYVSESPQVSLQNLEDWDLLDDESHNQGGIYVVCSITNESPSPRTAIPSGSRKDWKSNSSLDTANTEIKPSLLKIKNAASKFRRKNLSDQSNENLEMNLLPGKQDLSTVIRTLDYKSKQGLDKKAFKFEPKKLKPKSNRNKFDSVLKTTYFTTVLGLGLCALHLYLLYGIYGVLYKSWNFRVWAWFAFQSCSRIVELLMGCSMAYITKQPVDRQQVCVRVTSLRV